MHEEVVNPQMESVDPNDAEDVAQDGGLYPYCCDCSVLEPAGSGVNDFCRNCLLKEMSSVMQPPGLASVVVEEQSVTTGCDSERYTLVKWSYFLLYTIIFFLYPVLLTVVSIPAFLLIEFSAALLLAIFFYYVGSDPIENIFLQRKPSEITGD
ncbi:uncharacterized protein LOC108667651 isoform X1 [Hyalella azteca]|uniref:Uncharacterized protein LOC108667651 isoform X1 n=1 Tax=Hyalella azteca TaxID=294128 RepID=A0A8B7N8L6_HYAAZ|nr:uncharacterized protein LOC108667651 isoform X1 [Hyalella azteca]